MQDRPITRKTNGRKGSVVNAIGYRIGREELWDERNARLYKNPRDDVAAVRIALPEWAENDKQTWWAHDAYLLANTMEFAEQAHNGRTGRDLMFTLPRGMPRDAAIQAMERSARWYSNTFNCPVVAAYHVEALPRAESDHIHLVPATRELGLHGLLEKTNAEIAGYGRLERGLTDTYMEQHQKVRSTMLGFVAEAAREYGVPQKAIDEWARRHDSYRKHETWAQRYARMKKAGYDLNRNKHERNKKTLLTSGEKRMEEHKQRLIRRIDRLQARYRRTMKIERDYVWGREVERQKEAGTYRTGQRRSSTNDVYRLKRWDPTRGLLRYREIVRQTEFTAAPRRRQEAVQARQSAVQLQAETEHSQQQPSVQEQKSAEQTAGQLHQRMDADTDGFMEGHALGHDRSAASYRQQFGRATFSKSRIQQESIEAAIQIRDRHEMSQAHTASRYSEHTKSQLQRQQKANRDMDPLMAARNLMARYAGAEQIRRKEQEQQRYQGAHLDR